ncbi:hypothetical protein HON15_00230 [Candidatus Woesearchaeota archaeon]|nr:hypothetical protein [Candidatus Woesearchaeota archaeon]
MNNLENPQPNEKCTTYKHSMDECSVKLNGIKTLLVNIVSIVHDEDAKHMVESAHALCDELIRELQ